MSQPSKNTMIRKHVFVAPAAANNTGVHAAISTAAVITTAITQPDVPRTIRINGAGSGHNAAGVVTINGTDVDGAVISEGITLNGNTAVDGLKAFKTVTSIDTSAITGNDANNTVTVGFGASLGLASYCDAFSFAGFNANVTSFTNSLTVKSLNVVLLSSSLDGSTDQCVFYVPDTFGNTGRQWG